ncbi:MAG: 4-hydroxy-3-methylbut-2-enyl diphosphate reductase [Eubacterium sp.]|nr:4-hydroxy-3-methylbut-2-enyl diphosphate reductase [Eubacterium sp.]
MDIKVAERAGFCFGVKNAVETAYLLADMFRTDEYRGKKLVTLGPIIHNERVIDSLKERGVVAVNRIDDIDSDTTVIIRSHGVPRGIIDELEKRKIPYHDCTCPFVKKIHRVVSEHSELGEEIVIVGSPDHPEVIGILGWSKNGGTVIESIEQAEAFKPEKSGVSVCVVAQTTFNSKKFQDFVEIFSKKEYDINVVNTICHATRERQDEAEAMAGAVDAMIVIGGADSSNSKKLYDICKLQCENTFFIQTADAIGDIPIEAFASLGITAGASTPNTLIQEVLKACQRKRVSRSY